MFDRTKLPSQVSVTVTAPVTYVGEHKCMIGTRHVVVATANRHRVEATFSDAVGDEFNNPEAVQGRLESALREDINAALEAAAVAADARHAVEAKLPQLQIEEGASITAMPTEELLSLVRQAHACAITTTAIAVAAKEDAEAKAKQAAAALDRVKDLEEALSVHLKLQEGDRLGIGGRVYRRW